MKPSLFRRAWGVVVFASLFAYPGSAAAQSITKGAVRGSVERDGEPVWEARVILIDRVTGVTRLRTTATDGLFSFNLLPPSDYEVRVEKIPFQPTTMVVPVRPRQVVMLPPVKLEPVEMPVHELGVVPFAPGAVDAGRIGHGRYVNGQFLSDVAGNERRVSDFARFSGNAESTAGLPAGFASYLVEGIPVTTASHMTRGQTRLPATWLTDGALDGLEVVYNAPDVELAGPPGGWLVAYPRRGGREFSARAEADFTGAALASASSFDPGASSFSSVRAGVSLGGPIVRDTSHYAFSLYWAQTDDPRPRAWERATLVPQVLGVAADSFGVDLTPYTRPGLTRTNLISGIGRLDAQIGEGAVATVTAGVGHVRDSDPGALHAGAGSLGAMLEALDIAAVGTIASGQLSGLRQEFRFGFSTSRRDFLDGGVIPGSAFSMDGINVGLDPTLAGTSDRTNVTASETVFSSFGAHNVKLGLGVAVNSHAMNQAEGRTGSFGFGGINEWAASTGSFSQAVGGTAETRFTSTNLFFYVQDTWMPVSRVQLSFGMRMDALSLPSDRIPANQDWLDLTGLSNDGTFLKADSAGNLIAKQSRGRVRFAPRLGVSYQFGPNQEWVLSGGLGVYVGEIDAGVFTDAMRRSGGLEVRRGVGTLTGWPSVPDSVEAPVRGSSLAVLHPEFEMPRSFRASLGLARDIGGRAAVYASVAYRHTDYLPRLDDLNRPGSPVSLDDHDRPVWGRPVQQGSALFADPATNRRFGTFDRVTAVNPDGYSDYFGVTAGLERQVGDGIRFRGQYTYSSTTDNWLGGGQGTDARLNPFPDGVNGSDWSEGRSDFDVPHQATVGAVVSPGESPLSVSAYYRFESGRAFTPGFPRGVDMNADGSGVNDPAFIDAAAAGVASCLGTQAGRFAERNSCRAPNVQSVDLRILWRVVRSGGFPVQLTVDVLNLTDARTGIPDGAVYQVDPAGSVVTTGGVTTVPLVLNPDFGSALINTSRGRALRVGMRIGR